VLFAALEMSREEVVHRLVAAECKINLRAMTSGTLSDLQAIQIQKSVDRLRHVPLYIDDNPNQTIMDIRAEARRMQAKHGSIGLVVVDYLQLVNISLPGRTREQEVAMISRALKAMPKELGCPVLAVAQLSRAAAIHQGEPQLHHLRDSGTIEQDADVVMFLHRDEADGDGVIRVLVRKQRQGPTGFIRLRFAPEYTRFDEDWST
jgi:replicative DNA helicase